MDRKALNLIDSVYGVEDNWLDIMAKSNRKLKIYDMEKATAFLQTNGYKAEVGENGDCSPIKTQNGEQVNNNSGKSSLKDADIAPQPKTAKQQADEAEKSRKALEAENRALRQRVEYWKKQTRSVVGGDAHIAPHGHGFDSTGHGAKASRQQKNTAHRNYSFAVRRVCLLL